MNKLILEYFLDADLSITTMLVNVGVAMLLSIVIFIAYRFTYSGTAFSKRFMVSLGMMCLVTTVIMNVISNNIALSLGMVGALSIVRFRTAVKDVRDTTFIFWCIGVGICCGVSMYIPMIVGSAAILLFLLVMGQVKSEGKFLLVVKSTREGQSRAEAEVGIHFPRGVMLKAKNATGDVGDLIYELSERTLRRTEKNKGVDIVDALMITEGIISVDLVRETDDISR